MYKRQHIRQGRGAWVTVGGGQHAFMDAAAVADQLYLHPDILLHADGAVELLNQTVQWGIHLTAVDLSLIHI